MAESPRFPFLLSPAGKDYIWGGRRLKDDLCKEFDMDPLAETWECSTHSDGLSTVASGRFAGRTLKDVLTEHPEYMGTHAAGLSEAPGDLPIMIKFIDAKSDLSVQVHPDDEYAAAHENGSRGKAEMWYVIDSHKDTKLVYGFSHDVDENRLKKAIGSNTLESLLQYVPVRTDDVFFVEPGTVHAIGAGALVAEIQESSNLTYRLYDYGRTDKNGKPRELHIDKAMDVLDMKGKQAPRQPMRSLKFQRGFATELLGRCRYFTVERMLLNTERIKEMASVNAGPTTFEVLLVTDGCGMISTPSVTFPFFRGDCIFIPAESETITLHGKAAMLRIGC